MAGGKRISGHQCCVSVLGRREIRPSLECANARFLRDSILRRKMCSLLDAGSYQVYMYPVLTNSPTAIAYPSIGAPKPRASRARKKCCTSRSLPGTGYNARMYSRTLYMYLVIGAPTCTTFFAGTDCMSGPCMIHPGNTRISSAATDAVAVR